MHEQQVWSDGSPLPPCNAGFTKHEGEGLTIRALEVHHLLGEDGKQMVPKGTTSELIGDTTYNTSMIRFFDENSSYMLSRQLNNTESSTFYFMGSKSMTFHTFLDFFYKIFYVQTIFHLIISFSYHFTQHYFMPTYSTTLPLAFQGQIPQVLLCKDCFIMYQWLWVLRYILRI